MTKDSYMSGVLISNERIETIMTDSSQEEPAVQGTTLTACLAAAEAAAGGIKERKLLGRARGQGVKKMLISQHLPPPLNQDYETIKVSLEMLEGILSGAYEDTA